MTKPKGLDKLFNEIVAKNPPPQRGIHIQEAFRTPKVLTRKEPVHDTSQLRCQNTKQKIKSTSCKGKLTHTEAET